MKGFQVGATLCRQTPVGVQDEQHAEDEAPEEVDAEDVGDEVAGGDEQAAEGRPQGGGLLQRGQPAEHHQAEAAKNS